jgi:hypothetical protein
MSVLACFQNNALMHSLLTFLRLWLALLLSAIATLLRCLCLYARPLVMAAKSRSYA